MFKTFIEIIEFTYIFLFIINRRHFSSQTDKSKIDERSGHYEVPEVLGRLEKDLKRVCYNKGYTFKTSKWL